MAGLYGPAVAAFAEGNSEPAPLISGKVVDKALRRIYSEDFDPANEIETNLFNHTLASLNEATEKGFGKISYNHPDYEFLQEIKYNNAVFAAFKTHRQQNDLFAQLMDVDGVPKAFAQFKKDVEPIIGNYNINWLQTEYNTAIIRARMAVQWKQFEREKHIYPNLKWLPSLAAVPREAHKPFYNRVWALNDSFWKSHRPGDAWGCKCSLTSTDEPVTGGQVADAPDASPGLDNNPADDAKMFSDSHPYYTKGYGSIKARQELAEQAADRATLKEWAEDIVDSGMARGKTIPVGNIGKTVKKYLKKQGIVVQTDDVILSDRQLLHMLRDAKKYSPTITDIEQLREYLSDAEVYFDEKHKNLLFFIDHGEDTVLKFAIQPNYMMKTNGKKQISNHIITGGYVNRSHKNEKYIHKIRLK